MARNMDSLEELRVLPLNAAERQQENVTLVLATAENGILLLQGHWQPQRTEFF